MRYLVTGGCGFIGSHLVEGLLADGHEVVVIDNLSTGKKENVPLGAQCIIGDICDDILMKGLLRQVDGCFHLAAVASVQKSKEEWLATHKANAQGTVVIFDAIASLKSKIPVVFASSAAIYGDNPNLPLKEDTLPTPITAYGVDKYSSELNARVAFEVHQIPALGMRFFNVYGPRQDPHSPYSGVISIFSDKVIHNQEVTIFGDGEQMRDFIYVKDVVKALMDGMGYIHKKPCFDVFNICTGKGVTINQLLHTIEEVVHRQAHSVHKDERIGDIRLSYGDNTHLGECLAFKPKTDLQTGLTGLVESQTSLIGRKI